MFYNDVVLKIIVHFYFIGSFLQDLLLRVDWG